MTDESKSCAEILEFKKVSVTADRMKLQRIADAYKRAFFDVEFDFDDTISDEPPINDVHPYVWRKVLEAAK
jgi:hypothetical protein